MCVCVCVCVCYTQISAPALIIRLVGKSTIKRLAQFVSRPRCKVIAYETGGVAALPMPRGSLSFPNVVRTCLTYLGNCLGLGGGLVQGSHLLRTHSWSS